MRAPSTLRLPNRLRRPIALRLVGVVLAATAVLCPFGATTFAQAAPTPPGHLSWYGDPGAPDFSGVWVRAEEGKPASASPEGWRPWPPPLKGTFADVWRNRVAAGGTRTDDPVTGCVPPGMPRFITGVKGPLLIVQTRGRVMFYRDGDGPRRVWLDGRGLLAPADVEPFPKGTAIGRYEGKDLLVESVGFKSLPVDSTGIPHSEKLKISERYHRVDPQTLTVQVTLTDPSAYARPLMTTVTYKALHDPLWEPQEFLCTPGTDYHPDRYVH